MATMSEILLEDGDDSGARRRRIQRMAMSGIEPTADDKAWLASQLPKQNENVYRLADTLTPFPAMYDAYQDPSLANITRAGVQTAATVGKPLAALGALAGGYGVAAAEDAGLFETSANGN